MRRPEGADTVVLGPSSAPLPECAARPAAPGFRIHADFEDRGPLGAGGMAEVRRVFDPALQRFAAAKILRAGLAPDAAAAFVREARITAQLEHPGIPPVHVLASDRFTMPLIQGETLAERLAAREGSEPPRHEALAACVRPLLRVCEALSFAHARGVVHGDVKPENVMLGRFGEVYLMDWGVARVEAAPDADPPELAGTPAFMAPEQAAGRNGRVDARSDVFGLGAALYQVLTLRPPHAGRDLEELVRAARRCEIVPPHRVPGAEGQPAALCDIAMKALAKEPDARFQSADAMRVELERFLGSGTWFARREVAAGAVIVREGDEGDEAFLLESGACEVYRTGAGGEELLRVLRPGEAFGELAPIAGERRTASVRAREDASLLVISRQALERQLPRGSWPRQLLDTLARRFRQQEDAARGRPPGEPA